MKYVQSPSLFFLFLFFVALGHPLGASGARILNNLTYNLIRLNKKYGVGAACIGGGQGIAVVLERC
jgi:acetyl-CoA acyltransferase 2